MNAGKLRRVSSLNINDTRIAGLYDLEHTIGKGHFAVVKLARHVFTGEKVAVKVIDKTRLDPMSTTHMMQEVRCMKLVQHPNIIRLYEIIDTQTKLFLILELGDYDMYEYIIKHDIDKAGGFKEHDAQQYFSQIIKAIDYCHTLHVVHRDLKPENVIFFEKLGMVKLTDFGFSNLFTPGERLETSCGSLAYSAPEILLGDAYDAPAVDVWSLGVILYMLVCGRLPFQEANESETLTKILDCKFSLPDYVSTACKNLISRMLIRDPAKRATLSEVVQSPWVVAGDKGHAEALPLIERDHLPESAHTTIIEQMVAGAIGTEDEIVGAIEGDMYNYLTATYYLLAERVLGAYRQEQANRLLNNATLSSLNTCSEESNESVDGLKGSSHPGVASPQTSGGTNVLSSRSRSNSWRGSTNARRACSILKEESEEELSSYLRSSSRQSSRNSSPSVSMFGGVSVQSAGIRSSREHVSPQAIQELLEFSRLSGKRAASPDSRISSRSSSPPCSSGRASPAVTAIMSRLKAANLIPSTSGMRKLSSSPHLLGICEESEDGFSDSPNVSTSTAFSSGTLVVNPNRSFISGNSASLKRRGNRSASIGFVRNSQRFSDASSGDSTTIKNAKAGTPHCIFSTFFEHTTKPSTSVASSPLSSAVGVIVTPDRGGSDEDDVLGDLSPPKTFSITSANMSNALLSNSSVKTSRLKRDISTSSSSSSQSLRSFSGAMGELSDSIAHPIRCKSTSVNHKEEISHTEQPGSSSCLCPALGSTSFRAPTCVSSSPTIADRSSSLTRSIKRINVKAAGDQMPPMSVASTFANTALPTVSSSSGSTNS